ncbi:hypothetical protein TTRE_0000818701 [Trichuris trichiura]|uniref:Uncharacterized protein n=1 Tax=Trichuris trichiura TaxID=36087 RepID=A0A077ZHN3_TRITR|nr:hypothetical protein TTRE_0000818701 [Trichuris trichiura]
MSLPNSSGQLAGDSISFAPDAFAVVKLKNRLYCIVEEALKALQEEKEKRVRLELVVKEKERLQKTWILRIRHLKKVIGQLKLQFKSARRSSCSPATMDTSDGLSLSPEEQQLKDPNIVDDRWVKSETDEGCDSPSASVSS